MKKILFPTDFSETADNAFTYAVFMANKLGATLYSLHAYNLANTADMLAPAEIISSLQEEEEERALEKMEAYHRRIEEEAETDVEITPLLAPGFAADAIMDACRELKPDLVIMGTKGVTNAIDTILGSVTSQVIQDIDVPILAIPQNHVYSPISRIAYATDLNLREERAHHQLGLMTRDLGASLVVVHVAKPDVADLESEEEAQLHQYFIESTGLDELSLHFVKHDDVAKGLAQFMEKQQTEVLAVSTRHRGFFERLFHRSITRKLALYASKPLLVFHS